MATFVKFQPFVQNLAHKVFNFNGDQVKVALTDVAPVVTNNKLADLTEISYTNLSSRNVATFSSAETAGVYKLVLTDLVLTASGAVAQFRYIVLYDDTASNDELIGYYDYGSEVNMVNTDTLTLDFDATTGVLQIT